MRRPLGSVERRMLVANEKLGSYNLVGVCGLSEDVDVNAMLEALAWLHSRVTLLQFQVHEVAEGQWELRDGIPFDRVEVVVDEVVGPDQIVPQGFLDDSYGFDSPLWRVYVHPHAQPYVCLSLSHIVCDAITLAVLGNELLVAYDAARHGSIQELNDFTLPSYGPIEALIPPREAQPPKTGPSPSDWAFAEPTPIAERRTGYLTHQLSGSVFQNIVSAAHAHSASVDATFAAAALEALSQVELTARYANITTPIDVRSMCKPPVPPTGLGMVVLALHSVQQVCDDESFWARAQGLTEEIRNAEATIAPPLSDQHDPYGGRDIPALESNTASGYSVNVTQVRCEAAELTDHESLRYYFGFNSLRTGHCTVEVKIWSLHDYHYMVWAFTEPLVSREWAEQFRDAMLRKLLVIADEPLT